MNKSRTCDKVSSQAGTPSKCPFSYLWPFFSDVSQTKHFTSFCSILTYSSAIVKWKCLVCDNKVTSKLQKKTFNNPNSTFLFQEKEKEANEAAANQKTTAQGEECTIRTNPPLRNSGGGEHGNGSAGGGGAGPGSVSDACETCSQHKANSTSREALHKEGKHCTKIRHTVG